MKNSLSGIIFVVIICAGLTLLLLNLGAAWERTETPTQKTVVQGIWAASFEAALDETSSLTTAAQQFWGWLEYSLFHQGRAGVVIGADGWLYTSEELTCPPQYAQNFATNLAFIKQAAAELEQRGVILAIVIIPSKARITGASLPACRQNVYKDVRDTFQIAALQLDKNHFFKTDTHWTPEGARSAAQAVARQMQNRVTLPPATFLTEPAQSDKALKGDLLRYVPGVSFKQETYTQYHTSRQNIGLLDATPPPAAVLIGTSYSASAEWNFSGFLKETLQADVDNAAREGQGAVAAMKDYLASNIPAQLVVWEIPERYMLEP